MANSSDETKLKFSQQGKKSSANGRNSKKKKQQFKDKGKVETNQTKQTVQVEKLEVPVRSTVSMSSHDVEVTRDAVKSQEALEATVIINKSAVAEEEVKASSAETKCIENISDILVKNSDVQSEVSFGAAVNDSASVVQSSSSAPELVVVKNDSVIKDTTIVKATSSAEKESESSDKKEEVKVIPIKKDESKKSVDSLAPVFEYVSSSQPQQFKPILIDDKSKNSGSWLSRIFLLVVLLLCCTTVIHFMKKGLIKTQVQQPAEHSDVYAENNKQENVEQVVAKQEEARAEEVVVVKDKEEKEAQQDIESATQTELVVAEKKLVEADIEAEGGDVKKEVPMPANEEELSDDDASVKQVKSGLINGLKRSKSKLPQDSISGLIAKKSVEAGVSPVLVTAVVIAESSFNNRAVSMSGKRGLMQISPARELEIKKLQGVEAKAGDLFDPEYNLDLGVWYLKHLMNKYDGNLSKALMAYSWDEDTLKSVTAGEKKMPRWAGPYYANIQQYYNAIIGDDGQKLVLSLPKVDKNGVEKTSTIQVAENKAEVKADNKVEKAEEVEEKTAWEKSILAVGKHVSPQTKSEIISVIKEQSLLYDMDPAYLSAIIMAESAFDPLSTSDYGKRGLFQMQPKWARIVAETLGVTWQGEDALFEPEYNIELGAAYLQHLKLLFDDNLEKAAIAFNLTPYRVSRILAGKKKLPKNIEMYVDKLKANCEKYGCKSEITKSYLERLQKLQAK